MRLIPNVEPAFYNLVYRKENGDEKAAQEIQNIYKDVLNHKKPYSSGTPLHHDAAIIKMYSHMADQGDELAIIKVGEAYARFNKSKSIKILSDLVAKGSVGAALALARGYLKTEVEGGYGKNDSKYFEWTYQAAKLGHVESQYSVALEYFSFNENDEALYWCYQAAEAGYVNAILLYADTVCMLYNEFRGSLINSFDSELTKEAKTRLKYALDFLLNLFDYPNSLEHIQKASAALGRIFELGSELPFFDNSENRNSSNAQYYYLLSCRLGNNICMYSYNRLVEKYGELLSEKDFVRIESIQARWIKGGGVRGT